MNIEIIRYRLPVYWACPLIDDDYAGLTDKECEEIKHFLEAAVGNYIRRNGGKRSWRKQLKQIWSIGRY